MEALERGLRVMDSTALTLCMENDLPILVFNMGDEENIDRIVSGERVGTLVSMSMIDELLDDAQRAHGEVGRGDPPRVRLGAHRPRQPGAARPRPRRLLRRADAAASSSRRSPRPRRGC